MADLRARKVQGTSLASRAGHKSPAQPAVESYQSTPRPPRRSTRSINISISLAILAFFILYANNRGFKNAKKVYGTDKKDHSLPEWYAICSKEGKKIYTVPSEGGLGEVDCVVVGEKRVVDHGSLARVRRKWGDKASIGGVDQSPAHIRRAGGLQIFFLPPGHTLTPGLTDSHSHPLDYAYFSQLPLAGSSSIAEVISRVEAFVQVNGSSIPPGGWIEGMGWDQNRWEVKEFPTAADLDTSPILRGLPIALSRIDVHAQWVSPAIMRLLGDLPNEVEGGQIVRDANGVPTGVFVDNAIELIDAIRPPWTDAQRHKFLDRVTGDALSKGLTGVHDARVPVDEVAFYRRVAEEGKLGLRVYGMLHCGDTAGYCGDQVERVQGAGDGRFTLRSVKLFGDGALGSRGAALLQDYSDRPGWKGFMLRKEEDWKPLIKQWYDEGWQVNVHAIGDRANKVVLDAIESAIETGPSSVEQRDQQRRFRIEHAQIMSPEDLERAARMGVIGSFQPTHATSDMWYAQDRLGEERLKGAYAWKSYLKYGGRITLGSDFPVESHDPLKTFYAAVTRLSEVGTSPHGPDGWFAEEKLTREEALRGLTVDPAFASFSNDTGSLTPGYRFDAVIWDDDLMTVDAGEMLDTRVKAVIMDGQIVFGSLKG